VCADRSREGRWDEHGQQAAPRLKVFQAQIGFFDSVVAAPSQAAALRAWGSSQNLFAQGMARITTDADAVDNAMAHPGTPLRRALGSSEPFSLKPGAPKIEALEPEPAKQKPKRPAALKVVADRRDLDAAEAALAAVDEAQKRQEAEVDRRRQAFAREAAALAKRQADLDAEAANAKTDAAGRRARALAAVSRERETYRKQGGDE